MKENVEYEEQGKKFLKETNTEFKAEFLRNGIHFEGDKDKRDIYLITLKRGEREFKFNFGNSINASGEYTFINNDGTREQINLKRNDKGKPIKRYKGVYLNNGNSIKNDGFKVPTGYDVLSCLTKYDVGTFKDFCGEFGCDEDSIKAEKTYKLVVKEFDNIKMLYSDKEIEKLQEIN
mgnify:FL=1